MKKSVEEDIKKAFENWENKSTALGFDKGAVWKAIQKGDKKENSFEWRKFAAAILVLMLFSGLAYSILRNNSLSKENDRLAAMLQMQADSIGSLQSTAQTKIVTKIKIDTVVQYVAQEIQMNSESLKENVLKQQNEELTKKLQIVQQLLVEKDNLCGLLNDSVKVLIASLQSIPDMDKKTTKEMDMELTNTEEADFLALSKKESNKESIKESNEYRPRFKVVLFKNNKDNETANEAPKRQGIRF